MLLTAILSGLCGQFSVPDDVEWAETLVEASVVAETMVFEAENHILTENFAEISAEMFEDLGGSPSAASGEHLFYVARVGVFGAYENQDLAAEGARFGLDIDTRGNGYLLSAVMGQSTDVRPVIVMFESETRLMSLQSNCSATI